MMGSRETSGHREFNWPPSGCGRACLCRLNWRRAAWAALLMTLLAAAPGCATRQVKLELQALQSRQSLAEKLPAVSRSAAEVKPVISAGRAGFFAVTRYQWARLNGLSFRPGEGVQRLFAEQLEIANVEPAADLSAPAGEVTLAVHLETKPKGCCEVELQKSTVALTDSGGASSVTFAAQRPVGKLLVLELPPTAPGRPWTWVLLDLTEVEKAPAAAK